MNIYQLSKNWPYVSIFNEEFTILETKSVCDEPTNQEIINEIAKLKNSVIK